MKTKRWDVRPRHPDAEKIGEELGVSNLVAQVLANKGLGIEEAKKFLEASLSELLDPFLMQNMNDFVSRIEKAREEGQKVMVYGDYDVDGIVSTVMVVKALREIGIDCFYYIPNRLIEDYGLGKKGIDYAKEKGARLIISVDCGINAREEVDYAREKEIDILITDHHEIESRPDVPFLNPKGDAYPFEELAGTGVVLKLVQALRDEFEINNFEEYLGLAAIGTVSDVVPLLGENRVIVKNGLVFLRHTKNKGLEALKNVIGINEVESADISFKIGPRLNATGRLGDADLGVRLLLEEGDVEKIATTLDKKNKIRQKIERKALEEAEDEILRDEKYKDKFIVVGGKGWHRGVIGIVASRIVEKFHKPALVIAKEEEVSHGSGRSITNFNLFEALSNCKNYFESFGGHEMAAGLSIKNKNIDKFRKKVNEYVENNYGEEDLMPVQKIDISVPLSKVKEEDIQDLEKLRPFGIGNPRPVFCSNGLSVKGVRVLKDKHLKLNLGDNVGAIGFNMAGLKSRVEESKEDLRMCYSPRLSKFRKGDIELRIKDIKKGN